MRVVLAVDLGKTACRVALWVDRVRTSAEGAGSPGLASSGGPAIAEAAILAVAHPLLRAAGLHEIDAVGIGVAGALAAPEAARELAERLCASLPTSRAAVASDASTSHAGALDGAPGVVLAVGTGAVALAVDGDGTMRRIDGSGPWLGDEGGGAWLGLRGLRAALRAADGRGAPTLLEAAAVRRFGSLARLAVAIEGAANPPRLAATFAPDVGEAAGAGDVVAIDLLDQAAAALAETVRAATASLDAEGRAFAMTGGLLGLGSAFTAPILAAADAAGLAHTQALGGSLEGARQLALRDDTVHERHTMRARRRPLSADPVDLLATESLRPGLDDLDLRSPGEVARLVLHAERAAQDALARAADQLAVAADAVVARMRAGGRLFYLGAGTPGRLAVLDAAELAPTYSCPPGLVIALLAGGPSAMKDAIEGAEDDPSAAAIALDAEYLAPGDAVVGIAASGRTPFVVGGLAHARSVGALTVAIVNNPGSPAAAQADIAVEMLTGAELIAGSTRMTAGTTQKIALNAISTAAMVALGKTYGARMVDVRASNDKLRRRAHRMVREITGADDAAAAAALVAAGGRVKTAVVALLAGVDADEADRRLEKSGGRVRDAAAQGETNRCA